MSTDAIRQLLDRPSPPIPARPALSGGAPGLGPDRGRARRRITTGSVTGLDRLAPVWLAKRVNGRVHGTTGEVPDERLAIEREFLSPVRRLRRYDTVYQEPRRVHLAAPLIDCTLGR